MKNYFLIFALLATTFSFAQTEEADFSRMVEAEMKAASSIMQFAANANTQNYDITYHKLEFTVDPANYFISGVVTTNFTAKQNMNTVTFDLTNVLTVSSVKQGNTSLMFTQNANDELVITLPTTLTSGASSSVVITYSGAPATANNAFTASYHSGNPIIWTLSEPYGAKDWWPCKQDLNDKVNSIDVYITAPSQYVSVANGLQVGATTSNGNKTTHFHHSYPIPAYLIAIAVTNYQIYNQVGGVAPNTFPIVNYLYPENAFTSQTSLAPTPTIINLYETLIGPYPFRNEKYGHAQCGFGGGMEHTTVSFMGGFSRSLIAHEMAHQWFGDKVTCGSWKDIWLNEGITEFMSGMVVKNLDGNSAFISWKDGKTNSITASPDGNLYLTDAQLSNVGRIFSNRITYNKGSMVTNMLRFKMGDTNFFQALRNYLNDPALAYGYAITPQLQAHLEAVSGMNLTEFFNDWIYNEGYPSYNITVQNIGAGQAKIKVTQTQSHPSVSYFEMPLPIRLKNGTQTQDVIVDNTFNGQEFILSVPFTVTSFEFDPEKDIISKNNTTSLDTRSFDISDTILLYPNPSSDRVTIQLPTNIELKNIEIYNALGQLVSTQTKSEFSVSTLSNGIHFIKINTSEGVFHKNFIKK
ncbi:T9SS type A sorting domain-containing protein [Flavobacterium supellecticarium]|uniref:Aminopeptidase N n=1 Tax=Flavobacterium supellecticarium TaxID=2565924 RepID=A0A4S3ZRM7_9FLAO|nr:M1 family aminopeptidase [Flavobacterium supellecticarium]THF48195.1 T9SS type A sorting domain-containing protein [Flavobacterium supellecticarium]